MSIVDDGPTDGRQTDDGRRLDAYTISSPCEPNGSGELINHIKYHEESKTRKSFVPDTPWRIGQADFVDVVDDGVFGTQKALQ